MLNVYEFSCSDKLVLNFFEILFKPERIPDIKFFEIINFRLLVAMLFKKDSSMFKLLRSCYQEGLLNIFQHFNESQDIKDLCKQEYIKNYLCFLPYFEFSHGSKIQVPWFNDSQEKWELKDYQIEKILLNQKYFWMNQADLCYAYGLTELKGSQKILIISGTSYPCGEGFWTHVVNDISICFDVGYFLYQEGRDVMQKFIANDTHHCEVLGTSLGGAMALQLGLDNPDLKLVYALNPPGRIAPILKDTPTATTIVVYQANDFVSKFGYWHPDWLMVHYAFQEKAIKPTQFFDHFSNYALHPNITRQEIDSEILNQNRFWLTAGVFIGLRGLTAVILVWPIRYLIVPILKLIYALIFSVLDCFLKKDDAEIPIPSLV
jgi:hypothetical protein